MFRMARLTGELNSDAAVLARPSLRASRSIWPSPSTAKLTGN